MKKILFAALIALLLTACGKDNNIMKVSGDIEGLRLGTLYFQRMNDTALVNIDTLKLSGSGKFEFEIPIDEPEVFFLYLDKKDANPLNDRLQFFGEPGEITIHSTREYFAVNATIKGSKTQDVYKEFLATKSKFTNKNLELIEQKFNALKDGEQGKADSLDNLSEQNQRRRYLYSINFCVNHKDSEVSPYIALSDLYNVQMKYLDTINNTLTDRVANTKYGKMLDKFIKDEKENKKDSIK